MPFIIVRKNRINIYDINESIDTRIYMTEYEALTQLDKLQQDYDIPLTLAGEACDP
jgi:hypothetical protein